MTADDIPVYPDDQVRAALAELPDASSIDGGPDSNGGVLYVSDLRSQPVQLWGRSVRHAIVVAAEWQRLRAPTPVAGPEVERVAASSRPPARVEPPGTMRLGWLDPAPTEPPRVYSDEEVARAWRSLPLGAEIIFYGELFSGLAGRGKPSTLILRDRPVAEFSRAAREGVMVAAAQYAERLAQAGGRLSVAASEGRLSTVAAAVTASTLRHPDATPATGRHGTIRSPRPASASGDGPLSAADRLLYEIQSAHAALDGLGVARRGDDADPSLGFSLEDRVRLLAVCVSASPHAPTSGSEPPWDPPVPHRCGVSHQPVWFHGSCPVCADRAQVAALRGLADVRFRREETEACWGEEQFPEDAYPGWEDLGEIARLLVAGADFSAAAVAAFERAFGTAEEDERIGSCGLTEAIGEALAELADGHAAVDAWMPVEPRGDSSLAERIQAFFLQVISVAVSGFDTPGPARVSALLGLVARGSESWRCPKPATGPRTRAEGLGQHLQFAPCDDAGETCDHCGEPLQDHGREGLRSWMRREQRERWAPEIALAQEALSIRPFRGEILLALAGAEPSDDWCEAAQVVADLRDSARRGGLGNNAVLRVAAAVAARAGVRVPGEDP